jgi:ribosome-binding factor A
MSQRLEQLGSVIHIAVQRVITRGLNDPRVRGLISVTKVDVTPDLAEARVFVSVLPAEHSELTMHGLRNAARHIQSEIADEVVARRLPRLSFHLDESLKRQAVVDAALSRSRPAERLDSDHDSETVRNADANDPHAQTSDDTQQRSLRK